MKLFVNDACVGCGMCCGICPNVFSMNENGLAEAIDDEINEADIADAENTMNSCPVNAIEQK